MYYKHNLIVLAPIGAIKFVSIGSLGSLSDKIVTVNSGILNHMKVGELILADKRIHSK